MAELSYGVMGHRQCRRGAQGTCGQPRQNVIWVHKKAASSKKWGWVQCVKGKLSGGAQTVGARTEKQTEKRMCGGCVSAWLWVWPFRGSARTHHFGVAWFSSPGLWTGELCACLMQLALPGRCGRSGGQSTRSGGRRHRLRSEPPGAPKRAPDSTKCYDVRGRVRADPSAEQREEPSKGGGGGGGAASVGQGSVGVGGRWVRERGGHVSHPRR